LHDHMIMRFALYTFSIFFSFLVLFSILSILPSLPFFSTS
jgi:hypothetical protein